MANKFDGINGGVSQLGGVQPWSVGGDMPWTTPIVAFYPAGSTVSHSGYLEPVNGATGEKGPRFYYDDTTRYGFSTASSDCDNWIQSRKLETQQAAVK